VQRLSCGLFYFCTFVLKYRPNLEIPPDARQYREGLKLRDREPGIQCCNASTSAQDRIRNDDTCNNIGKKVNNRIGRSKYLNKWSVTHHCLSSQSMLLAKTLKKSESNSLDY